MFKELTYIPAAWSKMFGSRNFRNQFFITILVFVLVCLHDFYYLVVFQSRPGYRVDDIILNHLPPHDFSLPIFLLEYSTLLTGFLFLLPYPDRLVKGFQMASIVLLARTMSIYLVPLEPPKDMVALYDPLALFFLHTQTVYVTKDLFFSGHVSVLSLLTLVATNRYIRFWALITTVMVGAMLMCQHVHYSLDVFCAPFVAFVSYKFVLFIHRETRLDAQLSRQENW